MKELKRYVVGFLLDQDRSHVVLVRKNRPAWQAGRLNGVGGKIEPDESPSDAMAREFMEETGCWVPPGDWEPMCSVTWPDDLDRIQDGKAPIVHFFRSVVEGPLERLVATQTDEAIEVVAAGLLHLQLLIPNLHWLIPLALYTADRYEPFVMHATVAETIHPVALRESVMIYLDGSETSFKCRCGVNVFVASEGDGLFTCNGCGAKYRGEKRSA